MNEMLRYQLIVKREQFWLPAALVGFFGAITIIMNGHPYQVQAAGSLLALVFPMVGGILAASAVVEDPALELQLAAPRPPWRSLAESSTVILAIVALASIVYQAILLAIGVSLARYGDALHQQLIWLVPTVALMALGAFVAALSTQRTIGALVVGGIWLFEILARDWLLSGPVGRKLFVFIGALDPNAADLSLSNAFILAFSLAMLVGAGLLLRRTERYL